MNEVFLIGKVITIIDFEFIINSKINKSLVCFKIETLDKQIINVKMYNKLADIAYRKLKQKDFICINGSLENNEVIAKEIILWK